MTDYFLKSKILQSLMDQESDLEGCIEFLKKSLPEKKAMTRLKPGDAYGDWKKKPNSPGA